MATNSSDSLALCCSVLDCLAKLQVVWDIHRIEPSFTCHFSLPPNYLGSWIAPVCHCSGHKNQRFGGAAVDQADEGADQSG